MLCGMSNQPTERIVLPTLTLEHQAGKLTVLYLTKTSGKVRAPIDAKQLERWVARQIRAGIV